MFSFVGHDVLAVVDFRLGLLDDVLVVRGQNDIFPAIDGCVRMGQVGELTEVVHRIVMLLYA